VANDPRANTQLFKPCPPSYLGKAGAIIADSQSQRQKAFNALGKVGDLEILNNKTLFGSTGSRVGQGLRTLASISNSVRTGCGALPTVIGGAVGTALDTGANWVLENVGFSKTAVDQARYFNPGIANQAYGQAQQIYQRVKQGNFNFNSIPSVLKTFKTLSVLFETFTHRQSLFSRSLKTFVKHLHMLLTLCFVLQSINFCSWFSSSTAPVILVWMDWILRSWSRNHLVRTLMLKWKTSTTTTSGQK